MMYLQIFAFFLAVSGWMLVTSTLAIEYWKVYTLDGVVLATTTYMSNLWKICVADLTGISDCKDFPSLLALDDVLHACRALVISSVCLAFFANGLALIGMECTKIGGKRKIKAALVCVAGVTYVMSGLCSLTAFSLYAHQVTSEFFDPNFMAQKYDFGAALFIGWSGSFLCIAAGIIFCSSTACGPKPRPQQLPQGSSPSMTPGSRPTPPEEKENLRSRMTPLLHEFNP